MGGIILVFGPHCGLGGLSVCGQGHMTPPIIIYMVNYIALHVLVAVGA